MPHSAYHNTHPAMMNYMSTPQLGLPAHAQFHGSVRFYGPWCVGGSQLIGPVGPLRRHRAIDPTVEIAVAVHVLVVVSAAVAGRGGVVAGQTVHGGRRGGGLQALRRKIVQILITKNAWRGGGEEKK